MGGSGTFELMAPRGGGSGLSSRFQNEPLMLERSDGKLFQELPSSRSSCSPLVDCGRTADSCGCRRKSGAVEAAFEHEVAVAIFGSARVMETLHSIDCITVLQRVMEVSNVENGLIQRVDGFG